MKRKRKRKGSKRMRWLEKRKLERAAERDRRM
jgi:hypothetical protein